MKRRTWPRRFYVVLLITLAIAFPTIFPLAKSGMIIGGTIAIFGILFHILASGYLTKEIALTTAGPYRFVRNPFYVASLSFDCGLACMFSNPYLFLVYGTVSYVFIYLPRVREEESVLSAKFGESYTSYKTCVDCLIPWNSIPNGQGRFSLENLRRHHEISRSLNHVCLMSAVPVIYFFHQQIWWVCAVPLSIYIIAVILRRVLGL